MPLASFASGIRDQRLDFPSSIKPANASIWQTLSRDLVFPFLGHLPDISILD
jgi:hypothetical protein